MRTILFLMIAAIVTGCRSPQTSAFTSSTMTLAEFKKQARAFNSVVALPDFETTTNAIQATVKKTIADGNAALEAARRDPPDLLFLDLNIPGTSGADVLAALKADPATAPTRVIVVTAIGEEGRAEALRLGADEYFTKPFSPTALLQTVERVLAGGALPGA